MKTYAEELKWFSQHCVETQMELSKSYRIKDKEDSKDIEVCEQPEQTKTSQSRRFCCHIRIHCWCTENVCDFSMH